MINLTEYELGMLDGKQGAFCRAAMRFNMRYAEAVDAKEFVEVSRATLFIGAQRYLDCYPADVDYDKIFSEFYLCVDESIPFGKTASCCKTQTCGAACDYSDYKRNHLSREFHERNKRFLAYTRDMGVSVVDSCTPYYVGWVPLMGEVFVSTESSNVVISNSVFGARGNSDGVEAAVCAAITGRTPKYGMHITENRYATSLIYLKTKPETQSDWDVLGHAAGRLLPKNEVPVIVGDFRQPDIDSLRQFSASIATTSAAEICHIAGLTPEARTLEMALGGRAPKYEIELGDADIKESLKMLCDPGSGPVDYVSVGCPHLSLHELKDIAEYIKNKKIISGVELLVWTDFGTKATADLNRYIQIIEETGAFVLTGSCPALLRREGHGHAKAMAIYGAKQASAIRNQTDVPVYYGSLRRCIDAALTGYWEAQNGDA